MIPLGRPRVALVTGGTRGVGAAISERLARGGASVVAVYRSRADAAAELEARLAADGLTFEAERADLGNPVQAAEVVHATIERHGRIDYLVNCAAVARDARLRTMTIDDWDVVIRVDLSAVFYVTQPVMCAMVDRGFGRIVTIGSVAGSMGTVWQANYATAKAGLVGLTRSLARDGARHGVTANLIGLGPTATDMTAQTPAARVKDIVATIPVGRLARLEEVTHAVDFLLADDAGFITGTTLTVDGGMTMG